MLKTNDSVLIQIINHKHDHTRIVKQDHTRDQHTRSYKDRQIRPYKGHQIRPYEGHQTKPYKKKKNYIYHRREPHTGTFQKGPLEHLLNTLTIRDFSHISNNSIFNRQSKG